MMTPSTKHGNPDGEQAAHGDHDHQQLQSNKLTDFRIHRLSGGFAQKVADVAQLEQVDLFANHFARLAETESIESIIAMQLVSENLCFIAEGGFHHTSESEVEQHPAVDAWKRWLMSANAELNWCLLRHCA